MRKILFAVLSLLCAASIAHAQATTAVLASHVQGLNGAPLVSGSLCFQATDQNDQNIGIQVSGGGIVVTTPFCTSIANGVISTFNVPNPSTASPLNTRYRILVYQGSRLISRFPLAYICNQATACTAPYQFNFDTCLSSGACIANPVPITTGPAGPAGAPGLSCTFKGTYAGGTTYNLSDCVLYSGNYYISLIGSNMGNTPSSSPSDWQPIAGLPCTTTANALQVNSSGLFGCAQGLTSPDGNLLHIKGIAPFADFTQFGARAVSSVPTTTASCSGSTTISLTSGTNFQNGDGITIQGCGASVTVTAPSGVTVTPSVLSGPPGEGLSVASPTGSTTYSYKVVTIDRFGGYSAPSSITTITNGLASIGPQSLSVTSSSLSGDTLSVTPASSANISANAIVGLFGSTSTVFDGWFQAATTGSPFTITGFPDNSNALGLYATDTASGTGGTMKYYLSNHISWTAVSGAWRYCVYGGPGSSSFPFVGETKPSGYHNGYIDLSLDDLGTTYLGNQTSADCPASIPASAQNDALTTTIASGGGTSTIVVNNAATQTTSGQTTYLDDCPALLAAAATEQTAIGSVFIPPAASGSFYPINSFCTMPSSGVVIRQSGQVRFNYLGLIELQSTTLWKGEDATAGGNAPVWGPATGAVIGGSSGPNFYMSGQNSVLSNVLMNSTSSNGANLVLIDSAPFSQVRQSGFVVGNGSGNDYYSIAIIVRDTSCTENQHYFEFVGIQADQSASATPGGIYIAPAQNGSGSNCANGYQINADYIGFNGHAAFGFNGAGGASGTFNLNHVTRQGGPSIQAPLLAASGSASTIAFIRDVTMDTEQVPLLSFFASSGGAFSGRIENMNNGSPGGNNRTWSGGRPSNLWLENPTGRLGTRNNCNLNASLFSAAEPFNVPPSNFNGFFVCSEPIIVNGGYTIGSMMSLPTSPATTGPTAGGSIASGSTYQFAVGSVDAAGSWGVAQVASGSCATTPGNQTCSVSWTNPVGSASSNLWWCTSSCLGANGFPNPGNWARSSTTTGVTGSTITITSLNTAAHDIPDTTMAMASGSNNKKSWSPVFQGTPQPFASLASCTTALSGQFAYVSDSNTTTWGNTIAGGSTNPVLGFCDGTNWTVFAK